MKKILGSSVLVFFGLIAIAQNNGNSALNRPVNSICLGLLGDASSVSFNYERTLLTQPNFLLTSKLGLGYFRAPVLFANNAPSPEKFLTIPHHITGNLGNRKSFFEFGIGGTLMSGTETMSYVVYPIVGYRFHPLVPNRVVFRAFLEYPLAGSNIEDLWFAPFGVSIGVSF